ncbi:hypothetical protein QVN60_00555 [Yersinia aleksiciae]|nr:hypothetical protein [Yersinia aleksiciae]MDN0121703.1 hypothetical protein [Yersinia aleksiciae]
MNRSPTQVPKEFADACGVFNKYKDKLETAAKISAFLGLKGKLANHYLSV